MLKAVRHVVVGISGGVDSAVSALLLKRKGYEVSGLFMRNWDLADEHGRCTVDQDREDAQYICKHLHIPFHEVNFVKEYWNDVFNKLVQGLENGMTPNPDVLCNKYIKFDAFYDHAVNILDADAIATGHYARTDVGEKLDQVDPQIGVKLLLPIDRHKDQTLFLSQIPQAALQHTLFPLGDMTKDVVKKLATSAGLDKIAKKKESTGICFIGSRNFHNFIEEYIQPKCGTFIDMETGKIVGQHKGTHYWTRGQRIHIGGLSKAYFVAEVNTATHEILVVQGTDHPALFTQSVISHNPHWIQSPPADLYATQSMNCQFRYQHIHPLINISVSLDTTKPDILTLSLERPLRAITAGQYSVFYRGDECLGSAQILHPGPSLYALNQRQPVQNSKEFT